MRWCMQKKKKRMKSQTSRKEEYGQKYISKATCVHSQQQQQQQQQKLQMLFRLVQLTPASLEVRNNWYYTFLKNTCLVPCCVICSCVTMPAFSAETETKVTVERLTSCIQNRHSGYSQFRTKCIVRWEWPMLVLCIYLAVYTAHLVFLFSGEALNIHEVIKRTGGKLSKH